MDHGGNVESSKTTTTLSSFYSPIINTLSVSSVCVRTLGESEMEWNGDAQMQADGRARTTSWSCSGDARPRSEMTTSRWREWKKNKQKKNENIIAETGKVDFYGIYNRTVTMTPQRSAHRKTKPYNSWYLLWKYEKNLKVVIIGTTFKNFRSSITGVKLWSNLSPNINQFKKVQKCIVSQIQGIMVIFDFLALLLTFW